MSLDTVLEGTVEECFAKILELTPDNLVRCRADIRPESKPISEAMQNLRPIDKNLPAKLIRSYRDYGRKYSYSVVVDGHVIWGTTQVFEREG